MIHYRYVHGDYDYNGGLYLLTLSQNGAISSQTKFADIPGTVDGPAMAWNSSYSRYAVVWEDARDQNSGEEIYFATGVPALTPSASATVEPTAAATMALPGGSGEIAFPSGLVTETTTFVYTQQPTPLDGIGGFTYAGLAFTLEATDASNNPVTTFAKPFTFTLTYRDSDLAAAGIVDESLVNLYYWNGTTWIGVLPCAGCALYPVTNTLVAVLDHLTKFALLAPRAPQVSPISAPVDPSSVNIAINTSASWKDADGSTPHNAVWDWGDGSTSPAVVNEVAGSVAGSHTYTAPGVYTIRVRVTDSTGLSGESVFQYVVVYDPSAGYVTGGGWITSPTGAYAANPTLTGKATFGFVSRYQKGATVPTGQTEFDFHVANLNFHSSAYDWLVIAGAKAQYKGIGMINGSGTYGFLLTAIDGQVNGGGDVDRFRIKIWDKTTGTIVYDNQMAADDTADPTTVIAGGSIVIHKD